MSVHWTSVHFITNPINKTQMHIKIWLVSRKIKKRHMQFASVCEGNISRKSSWLSVKLDIKQIWRCRDTWDESRIMIISHVSCPTLVRSRYDRDSHYWGNISPNLCDVAQPLFRSGSTWSGHEIAPVSAGVVSGARHANLLDIILSRDKLRHMRTHNCFTLSHPSNPCHAAENNNWELSTTFE